MNEADKSRLITAIFARLKIRLGENDPAFVLVELNSLILEQTIRTSLQRIAELEARLSRQADPAIAAEEIATLVVERLAKVPTPNQAVAKPRPRLSAFAWIAAFTSAVAVALVALTVSFELGAFRGSPQ